MSEPTPVELSIVVPAYNEAARLPDTLRQIEHYLNTSDFSAEVIIADDGSTDATAAIARACWQDMAHRRVLTLRHRGKAATVRDGVLAANGRYILFTDADLSTPIGHADALLGPLRAGADVVIGSREGVGATRIGEPFYRHAMGRIFNLLVRLLAVPGINDTQCGFKGFRRVAAHDLFRRALLHAGDDEVRGPRVTGFDVEILYLARRRGYDIVEVPVYWEHVAGSKVQPLQDSFRMFADVLRVRWNALRGRYDAADARGG